MAAAGVDGSNTGERGGWLLLPHDPDGICEQVHDALVARHGVRLGVVLSDTAGRAVARGSGRLRARRARAARPRRPAGALLARVDARLGGREDRSGSSLF